MRAYPAAGLVEWKRLFVERPLVERLKLSLFEFIGDIEVEVVGEAEGRRQVLGLISGRLGSVTRTSGDGDGGEGERQKASGDNAEPECPRPRGVIIPRVRHRKSWFEWLLIRLQGIRSRYLRPRRSLPQAHR